MINVIVVDDHQLFREGIITLLDQIDDIKVVGQADNGLDALEVTGRLRPDVVVMDIMMKGLDGVEAAGQLMALHPRTEVVLVTMYRDPSLLQRARHEAGVKGYVLKQDAFEDLVSAVRAVARHARFISPSLEKEISDDRGTDTPGTGLTKRQREILALVARGRSSQDIADKLFLSIKTVETHRRHISQKLDLHGPADFARYAIRIGLIQA